MSVSSVSAAPVVTAPLPIDYNTPERKKADDDSDTRLALPPVRAALPPGQGTRIDQLA